MSEPQSETGSSVTGRESERVFYYRLRVVLIAFRIKFDGHFIEAKYSCSASPHAGLDI